MFRKPRFRPNGPQPYVEEFVVKEVHPVLTHYVTNKVYRHVHQFPHQNDTVIRETIGHHLFLKGIHIGEGHLAKRGDLIW